MGQGEATTQEELEEFVLGLVGRIGIDPSDYTFGELVTIANEANYDKQVDRACAAQSPDMLPKRPVSPKEKAARKAAIKAKVDAQFRQHQ